MKSKCGRWDENGKLFIPLWDGQQWLWFDAPMKEAVDESEVPKSRVLIRGDAYDVVAYWYNEDGTSPDTRASKTNPYVTRVLRIPRHTRVGRERPLEEVAADIDYWLAQQPADIEECVKRVTRKPKDSSRFAAVAALRLNSEDD